MTKEEKAEEYAKGKAHEHYNFLFEENCGSPVDFAKLCYLDGLTEGRKEKECNCMTYLSFKTLEKENTKFEKENAELKKENKISEEIIIGEQQEINELKKHRDKLLKNSVVDLQKIDELEKEIKELNEKFVLSEKDLIESLGTISQRNLKIEQLEKENEQLKCDLYNTDANLQHITIEYEKENKELLDKLNLQNQRLNELKKETERLSAVDKMNELLLKHQNSLKKEVHDLRRENKELRCCENCKWYKDNDCIGDIVCTDNDWNGWELAE